MADGGRDAGAGHPRRGPGAQAPGHPAGAERRDGSYVELVRRGGPVLTAGPTGTRLRFGAPWPPDPTYGVSAYAGDDERARVLRALFVAYATTAREFDLPVLFLAPRSRDARGGDVQEPTARRLDRRALDLLREAIARVPGVDAFVAGLVGPTGDAYGGTPPRDVAATEARQVAQSRHLAGLGLDLLLAAPFSSVPGAVVATRAMATTGLDHVVAWVVDADGRVLDGTPLDEAIRAVDATTVDGPAHHLVQCVHPRRADAALASLASRAPELLGRVGGVKANAADEDPDALDDVAGVRGDDPEPWAEGMAALRERYGVAVLGGCCGTDERHQFSLALRLATTGR